MVLTRPFRRCPSNMITLIIHLAPQSTLKMSFHKRVLLEDIYVNSTSHSNQPARNTDGANTMFSDSIILRHWEIDNSDDCIAFKANSTNMLVEDLILHGGNGIAVGSICQYSGRFETDENILMRNLTMYGSKFATRIKTWTGEQNQWPPNGGGGGPGCESFFWNYYISVTVRI